VGLQVDAQGIATLALQDQAGKNAFSLEFVAELEKKLAALATDENAKVCVLTGLEEVFCAGGDRDVLLRLADGRVAPYDLELTGALLDVPIPTIAAMAGHAVGGGLVFGLCCDIVLMARESRYGFNFMEMGFTPGMGTTRLVQAALGDPLAAEMMYGGQYFKGRRFERSLVNYVLPRAEVERKAHAIAARFADKPRFALALLKRSLGLSRRRAFDEARTMESMMHEICFAHPETKARIEENYPSTTADDSEDA
jgi:polyketide biosynthesis enoyl-CoA hydratase PksI